MPDSADDCDGADAGAGDDVVHFRMRSRSVQTRAVGEFYLDDNGCPTEVVELGGREVIIHYDDVPETDMTVIDGIRRTTALRTAIDIAPSVSFEHLAVIVADCVQRGLFTVDEALARVSQPDICDRAGARLVRRLVEIM